MKLIVAVSSKRDARMSFKHSTATKNVSRHKYIIYYFCVVTRNETAKIVRLKFGK